jgi:uncharacterized membrane protein HdeD (DUF308 family)
LTDPLDAAYGRGVDQSPSRHPLQVWLVGYLLVRAVAVTVVGILLLTRPSDTVLTLTRFVGWVLIALAVIDLVAAMTPGPERSTRRLILLRALLTGVVGTVMVLLSDVTVTAVAILVGMQLVVSGGVNVLVSLQMRSRVDAWVGVTARGALALIAGILALVWPRVTIVVIALILGMQWLIGGLVSAATAVAVASRRH